MPTDILMPALSPTMEEGTLAKWYVKEGDKISSGDIIAEIETDKATMEFEAIEDGTVGALLVAEGTEGVKVNEPIARVLGEDEDANAIKSESTPPKTLTNEQVASKQSGNGQTSAPVELEVPTAKPRNIAEPQISSSTDMHVVTLREALRDAMAEEMRADGNVFVMGEEVAEYQGAYKVTQGLLDEFGPRRVIDTPITEHGFTGLGVGAAFGGLKPIVEFMTFNFAMQAIDQIVNSAGKTLYMSGGQMTCSIVFRGPNGAASRVAAQHSQDYSSWYAQVPGLKVVAPYGAADAKGLLKAAIRDPNPVIFLENEILYGRKSEVPIDDDWVVPIGKAKILREGTDVTIVSYARGIDYALEAGDALAEKGVTAEIIDLRSLRPLDIDAVIDSVKKTNRLVTVDEGWPVCSIGTEVSALIMEKAFDHLDAPVLRVAGKDVPMPYAANLEKLALPSVADVIAAVEAVTYRN